MILVIPSIGVLLSTGVPPTTSLLGPMRGGRISPMGIRETPGRTAT